MKIPIFQIFIVLALLCTSCNSNSSAESTDKQTEIPDFLKKYKQTTLPIKMKGCFGDSYGLPLVHPDSINGDNEDGSLPYCAFETNGDYFAVIRLGLADCMLPNLITFDKSGKLIDEKEISIGYCGSGPGFKCEEYAIIDKDFSIYTSDTISVTNIDSLGNEIESTLSKYIIYKKGKLLSSGKIELTDTIRQVLIK